MLITDGHHLPGDFVRTALAAKGSDQIIITSDSAPAAGLPPGDYDFFGTHTRLEADGRLHSPQTGTLAGSAATLLQCMNWLAGLELLDEAGLWAVGRDNPLRLLGLSLDSLPAGTVAWENGCFKSIFPGIL
jgi:N-acetylglucosamine-6-phosphate deacetylase